MKRLIAQNLKPLALIVLLTTVGALIGNAFIGFLMAVSIISLVTLLVK